MENSNIKVVGALLIGAAVGGVLGVLLAPKKGSDTRKMITDKTDDLGDLIKEKFQHVIHDLKKEVEVVREKAGHLIADGKTK